jgi:DNA-binding GntR family transcriptional regulator
MKSTLNNRFHYALCKASGNGALADVCCGLLDKTVRYRMFLRLDDELFDGVQLETQQEHAGIAKAIRARNPDRTEELVRTHMERTLSIVERVAAGLQP